MASTPDFDPRASAATLLRTIRSGALGTLSPADGSPYCSLVNIASATDGSPLLLISALALHTQHLQVDPRVSLLLEAGGEADPLLRTRMTLSATAAPTADAADRRRYLACHPEAEAFAGFKDFGFYRLSVRGAHLVAGFGRIVDLAPAQVLTDLSDCAAVLEAEPGIIAHMNADHLDAISLYAEKLAKAPPGPWRSSGCDPDGIDLTDGERTVRIGFPERVRNPAEMRTMLRRLATEARGGSA